MTWRLAPIIGLFVLLCPVLAKAQTNLDQGKSASQIFANACIECHKESRGLAKGRSAAALTEFLREHYTTNAQQAAALAAYVMGGRSVDTAPGAPPTQGRTRPAPERASAEEPKPPRQGRKPEERAARNPAGQAARPSEQASPNEQPTIMRPIVGPVPTAHNRRKDQRVPVPTPSEPDTSGMQAPAAAAAEPAGSSEPPNREPSREPSPPATAVVPTEAAPAQSAPAASGENSAVPRDHIPD